MAHAPLVFALFAALAAIATLARRISVPYPILLVLGGAAIGFAPGLPRVHIDPDQLLLVFLPPLLYSSSLALPLPELRANLRPIGLLAVGLVIVTTVVVAVIVHATAGFPWAVAFTLGAIVSPPDPVAARAIAERVGLPRRVVTILIGEGLFNDATALVIYRRALVAAVAGSFSLFGFGWRFGLSATGAVLIGLAVGWSGRRILSRLVDPPVENTVTLLLPFAAWLLAERVHASGVLAVLAAGLYVARYGRDAVTSAGRLLGTGLWEMVVFILEGLSFLLIGLELRNVVAALGGHALATLSMRAVLVCAAVIVVRLAWVYPAAYLPRAISRHTRERDPYPGWRVTFVVGWAGMRGVVSMAAALAVPLTVRGGGPFPRREELVFLTFCVILVTLVLQGLTLPLIARRLGVVEPEDREEHEEVEARTSVLNAALARLDELQEHDELPDDEDELLRRRYELRLQQLADRLEHDNDGDDEVDSARLRRVHTQMVEAERAEVLRLFREARISSDVFDRLRRDIDTEATRIER